MQVSFHCFSSNKVKTNPSSFSFPFKGMLLSVSPDNRDGNEGLTLQLSRKVTVEELSIEGEIQDDQGVFIEKRMRPFKEAMTEAAQLVEGLLSILYYTVPPKFDTDKIVVNVLTESKEEEDLKKNGKITGGFGTVFTEQPGYLYEITDKFTSVVNSALDHLPALSFLAQGIRSQNQNEQEIAFFLYFRVIDGYFSDGVTRVENALLAKANELSKCLDYDDNIKSSTKNILTILKLPSKCNINFEGLISDITLIRHKLTHFSKTHADKHHRAEIGFDLNKLNFYLRKACIIKLHKEIGTQ